MNHSETAFVEPLQASPESSSSSDLFASAREFRLRWFTPTCEVPCCGHATIASAAVLMAARGNPHPAISFHTLSGELLVGRARPGSAAASFALQRSPAASGADGSPTAAASDAPLQPPPPSSPPPAPPPSPAPPSGPPLVLSLSLPLYDPIDPVPACAADPAGPLAAAVTCGLPVTCTAYCEGSGLRYVLMELAPGVGRRQLERLVPDFPAMLAACGEAEVHGVIVCARADDSHGDAAAPEVFSRFFGPWMGINEDPVTGSAHAVLGPYWEGRLRPGGGAAGSGTAADGGGGGGSSAGAAGKTGSAVEGGGEEGGEGGGVLRMRQCSARGGNVAVEVLRGEGRVRVSGAACIVLEGMLRL